MEGNKMHHRESGFSATSTATTLQLSGSPESRVRSDPFGDEIPPAPQANPFSSPLNSRPVSSFDSSSEIPGIRGRYFHSRRIKGDEPLPWLSNKDPKEKWVSIIPLIGLGLGVAIAGFLVFDGMSSVVKHKYCPVMSDDFSGGFNTDIWMKEQEVGGFGNGQFEQTTATEENVYIENGKLIIKPTLQDAKLIDTNTIINLTASGTCTSNIVSNCVTETNTTTKMIIQPVKSGRISTRNGPSIKYGRVQVTATLPTGDWLWPAIWMLPVNNTYGPWPLSGEIDIVESRGNNHTYEQGGNNIISSALHWGPDFANDAWWRTNVKRSALHTTYALKEHTFGLEWSQKYIFTWINNRLMQVLYTNFNQPLWARGGFPQFTSNGSRLIDPWTSTGRDSTPFDQKFYLIMNVAVGGTNGWFEDGKSGKPWSDSSLTAKYDFWNARDEWAPTWNATGAGQMQVSSVIMEQQCDGDENA